MGSGPWRGRENWPLHWLQVVKLIKKFGFQVTPSFKQSMELTWNSCVSGFRQLNTLFQCFQVLKLFATSKLWYVASGLPLPAKFLKKIESLMGSFLWAGRLKRLQLDEVKNTENAGGLGLPCVFSKANSLFLKQTCRLLMCPGSKQYGHLRYWIGLYVRDFFPDMAAGPHAELICP